MPREGNAGIEGRTVRGETRKEKWRHYATNLAGGIASLRIGGFSTTVSSLRNVASAGSVFCGGGAVKWVSAPVAWLQVSGVSYGTITAPVGSLACGIGRSYLD